MKALLAITALALALVLVAPSSLAFAQTDPAPTAAPLTSEATEPETTEEDEPISNLGVLLFGSALLAGGVWAYQNRGKRGYRY